MLYVVLGIVLITLFLLAYFCIGSTRRSTVLITGPCDAGKTSLLIMLAHKRNAMTFTSLIPNVEDYELRMKNLRKLKIVDVPGLEKLRFECINKQRANTGQVLIFPLIKLIVAIQNTLKDTAEYLFDLMTNATLARSRAPFLILCNKNDLPDAKDAVSIEQMLETELTTLCRTKANALAGLDGHQELRVPLVKKSGEKFLFAECKHHCVTFATCSVTSTDISPVRLWLERL
ncbi:Signal recognition particle receptor subunit beta [Echinococcus granulosus]|uniref:Signal recognition particle receptor subunit beta n=1 Tax=Echinococcus granulosus TaxID=6210 RepID=W6UT75_ECHGR|nr:Signal recognition particle receptor subunit beta [Echinococcus granulosus]EUB64468.1 Signal recognition particle receptor subunit beta [Echinococcus granulosus]